MSGSEEVIKSNSNMYRGGWPDTVLEVFLLLWRCREKLMGAYFGKSGSDTQENATTDTL